MMQCPEPPQAPVNYEEIDPEIRYLVRLVNSFEGITTLFSCAGHEENEETYISFVAADQASLQGLLQALPFIGWRGELVANRFNWTAIVVIVDIDPDQKVHYNLRVSGQPRYTQRLLLDKIEKSLAKAIPQAERPLYSTHASGHSADILRTPPP